LWIPTTVEDGALSKIMGPRWLKNHAVGLAVARSQ